MSAYLITDVEVTDEELYAQFRERMTPAIESYGGKFIERGGAIEIVDGSWTPTRLAIVEFASMEQAHAWLDSAENHALDEIRTKSSRINMVLVEGV